MRIIGCIIGFLFWCLAVNGQSDSILIQLNTLIEKEHQANQFDGTIIVGNAEGILFQKAIGTANRVWNIPMTLDTRFDIASLNKSFIAALTVIAVKEEKLQLADKLVDILSEFKYNGQFDSTITIHQLLTHTSGLADYDGVDADLRANNFLKLKRSHFSNAEYVDFISQIPPKYQPNQQFYYSNFGYHLLSIILEHIYQKPFEDLLQEKICKPLGLTQTFSSTDNQAVFPKMAEAYNYNQKDKSWSKNDFIDLTLGRRIFSTTIDLYRWALAMNDTTFLSDTLLQLIQTNYLQDITANISYGYGWVVFDGKGEYRMGNLGIDKTYIIHGGNTGGYRSILVNINHGEYVVSILSNIGRQTNEMDLLKAVLKMIDIF